jgi:hypothetical protein
MVALGLVGTETKRSLDRWTARKVRDVCRARGEQGIVVLFEHEYAAEEARLELARLLDVRTQVVSHDYHGRLMWKLSTAERSIMDDDQEAFVLGFQRGWAVAHARTERILGWVAHDVAPVAPEVARAIRLAAGVVGNPDGLREDAPARSRH